MDSVRFGRALGFGARSAAKAIAGAVDAATAPNPSAPKPAPSTPASQPAPTPPRAASPPASDPIASAAKSAARVAAQATVQSRETRANISRGTKRFGQAVGGPLIKLSGVLWLEITGSFFGIFALFAANAAWLHRADLNHATSPAAHRNAFVFVAMAVVFGYFCISSFIRAHRRQRSS